MRLTLPVGRTRRMRFTLPVGGAGRMGLSLPVGGVGWVRLTLPVGRVGRMRLSLSSLDGGTVSSRDGLALELLEPLDRGVTVGDGRSGDHEEQAGEQNQAEDEPLGIHREGRRRSSRCLRG
jgi:hypothetical protein